MNASCLFSTFRKINDNSFLAHQSTTNYSLVVEWDDKRLVEINLNCNEKSLWTLNIIELMIAKTMREQQINSVQCSIDDDVSIITQSHSFTLL